MATGTRGNRKSHSSHAEAKRPDALLAVASAGSEEESAVIKYDAPPSASLIWCVNLLSFHEKWRESTIRPSKICAMDSALE